ncbi:ATP-binding cassette domain-containing protein [Oerskovia sp. M15]
MGLDVIHRGRLVSRLSGGQRTRLGLAALLIRQPGALLLDEPTNHLDDEAAEFLASALRALPGAVLLASHDRVFLDEVCTEILDLDPRRRRARPPHRRNPVRRELPRLPAGQASRASPLGAAVRRRAGRAQGAAAVGRDDGPQRVAQPRARQPVQAPLRRQGRARAVAGLAARPQRPATARHPAGRAGAEAAGALRFAPPHLARERAASTSPGRSAGRRGSQGGRTGPTASRSGRATSSCRVGRPSPIPRRPAALAWT